MKPSTLLAPACLLALAGLAAALDWPQWQGPDRSNVSRETGLLRRWPPGGPRLLWTARVGRGYTAPAVVGDRVYTMGARKRQEYLIALDARTGREKWACLIGPVTTMTGARRQGNGPRGTPAVDGDRVYGLGSQGNLVCARADGGERLWMTNLPKDLGAELGGWWGFSESPLADGGHVVCTPGGKQGTVAALDRAGGKVLWRSKELTDAASYASLVVSEAGGVRQYVVLTSRSVAGVDARDGKVLWRYARPAGAAVAPTPVCFEDFVFVTSGYQATCLLLRVTAEGGRFKAQKVYRERSMVNHHGGVLLFGGHIYGYSDPTGWTCLDARSGAAVPGWGEKADLGKGSLTCADGCLYCFAEEDGTVALAEANPKTWAERGRFKLPPLTKLKRPPFHPTGGNFWAHPVVANGRLYLRDQNVVYCYDVRASGGGG